MNFAAYDALWSPNDVAGLLIALCSCDCGCPNVQASKPAKVAGQKRQGGKQQQQGGGAPSRKVGTRCLAIMERLAGGVGDAGRGLLLADALVPLLQQAVSGRCSLWPHVLL